MRPNNYSVEEAATAILVGGQRPNTGEPHTHMWQIKIGRGILAVEGPLRSEGSQPTLGPPAQGSSARRRTPVNFWL